ncbi:SIS domain-containing protein [Lacticaseibacillus camelliae]|nr:SIS domain-containing protein [Lacticaseibacillus camelliae]
MSEFIANADIALFDQLAQAIHRAPRVFIFCFSTSRLIANVIQTDLARYGKVLYVPSTSDEQVVEAKQLRHGDLAIVISTYGYFISKSSATIDLIANSPADTALFTQNPGIPEAYLFKSVYPVTKTNNPITGSYIMLLAAEFLGRRYAETIGDMR